MAIDLRGHGDSHTDNDEDLSADTLARYIIIFKQFKFSRMYFLSINKLIFKFSLIFFFSISYRDVAAIIEVVTENSPVILVGHSMGGAVAVRAAPLISNIAGIAVIDVVEGTAMDALTSMQSFLRSRPNSFATIPQAIEWW